MPFIIDTYDKYSKWDRECTRFKFDLNGQSYGIKEISFQNGPKLSPDIWRNVDPKTYRLYDTFDEALEFVKYMK